MLKEMVKSYSEKETFAHGAKFGMSFAKRFTKRTILILLFGPVGAGKTAWVKGFVWGYLKKKDIVTSSSYSLVNGYSAKSKEVIHIDLYRLQNEDDLESTGFWDYLTGKRIVIVEWGDMIKSLPKTLEKYSIRFEVTGVNSRNLVVT